MFSHKIILLKSQTNKQIHYQLIEILIINKPNNIIEAFIIKLELCMLINQNNNFFLS